MIFQVLTQSLDRLADQWDILARAFDRLALDIDVSARVDRDAYDANKAAQDARRKLVKAAPAVGWSIQAACVAEATALRTFVREAATINPVDPQIRIGHTILRAQASAAILQSNNLAGDRNAIQSKAVTDVWMANGAAVTPIRPVLDPPFVAWNSPASQRSIRVEVEAVPTGFGPAPTPGVAPPAGLTPILDGFAVALANCRERLDDLQRYINRQIEDLVEMDSDPGFRANVQGIRTGVEDLGSFPILTTATTPATAGPIARGGSGGSGLQVVIETAFRQVLGRTPRVADTRSFVAALNQSFEVKEVDGASQWKWLPRTYAGQAELGGKVTGAQASLYAHASAGLDRVVRLVDAFRPLDPAADMEEMTAIRAIVRSDFTQIVYELKTEGGPRVPRVDQLFELLVGPDPDLDDKNGRIVDGHLGNLRDLFGFEDGNINTLDEEGVVSDFIAVQDYALAVRTSWLQFKRLWQGQDLGSRLVLLARALSVVADSVQEVNAAMDSVYVGAAERQVATFPTSGRGSMSVEDLLTWIVSFASDEAPRLIHEGGRRGVTAIQPTAVLLESLVRDLLAASTVPSGLRHPRVRRPLEEVRGFLDQIQQLAEDVRKPLRQLVA